MGWSSWPISRFLSFCHAICCVVAAIKILGTLTSEILWDPGVIRYALWSDMFRVTYCYLAFDIIMMLLFPTKGDWQYITHHFFGGIGIWQFWYFQMGWLIGLIFELTEMSTIFLNITWYLNKSMEETRSKGYVPDPATKVSFLIAGLMLLASFFMTRIFGAGVIAYYIYDHHEFFLQMYWIQYYYLFGGCAIISGLNFYWFFKLLQKLMSQF